MDKPQLAINLLRDDFFKGEIEHLKQLELNKIENSEPEDVATREFAYSRLNAIKYVLGHFESLSKSKEIEAKKWKIL
jgi:hypothetical protein